MVRFLGALAVAVAITLGLLYLMQSLITGGEGAMTEPPRGSVLDFVRVEQDESVEQRERKPQRPPEPEQPPEDLPQPDMSADASDMEGSGAYEFSADVGGEGLEGGLALDASDGEYLPIVKVQAQYPRRALQRGIEGYVVVGFTVTPQGTVRDPYVIE